MAYRLTPAGKLQVHLGEDLVIGSVLRDRNNTIVPLTGAGVNITFYRYDGGTDALTADMVVDSAANGEVSASIPATAIWEALSAGLYRYQIKVAQGLTVLVAEQGTLTVLPGSLGPSPSPVVTPPDPPTPVCAWVPIAEAEIGFDFTPGGSGTVTMDGSTITAVAGGFNGSSWGILASSAVRYRVTVTDYVSPDIGDEAPSDFVFGADIEIITNTNTGTTTEFDPNPATAEGSYTQLAYTSGSGSETGRAESYTMLVEVYLCSDPPMEE